MAACWKPLASVMGPPAAATWILVNAVTAFFNLLPSRGVDIGGSPYRSDGLALLQIPRAPESQLQVYRLSALLVRALSRYELEDFAGAQVWLEKAIQRVPDNPHVILILGACKMGLEDYPAAFVLLEPLLGHGDLPVSIRVALCNNIGYSLAMMNVGEFADAEESALADRLSAEAMAAFPCILLFRNTRALVLAATQRPEEALSVLEYVNYSSGVPAQVAMREVIRAVALRKLGRADEAEKAAALALRKSPGVRSELRQLGIEPPSEETQLRLLGKPVPAYLTWLRGIPSSLKEEARNVSDNLSQPQRLDTSQSALLKVVGAILALIGGAAGALLVLLVFRLVRTYIAPDRGVLIFAAILFGVSAFCLNLGYRLVLNRPNRYGSLLSPGAWRVMALWFVMVTLFLAFFTLRAPPRAGAPGTGIVLAPLLFAACCWMAGRAAQRTRA
jgi:tetratricopeptide (TPR) repeat protein